MNQPPVMKCYLYWLLSWVKSKHFVISNSKIPLPCKECGLLSWKAFIRAAEATVTWSICACIIRYMQVEPSTKRWSIFALTVDGILLLLCLRCHFSWSQATRVDHTKQERVSACFVFSLSCWRDDAPHQYSVNLVVLLFALELQLSSNVLNQIMAFHSRSLTSFSQNSHPQCRGPVVRRLSWKRLSALIHIQWISQIFEDLSRNAVKGRSLGSCDLFYPATTTIKRQTDLEEAIS